MMTRRILLMFPADVSEKPIITYLVRDYDLEVNIYRALVNKQEEGYMVLDISGEESKIEAGIKHLQELRIQVSQSRRGLQWNQEVCTSCGNCLTHCPTEALHIPDRSTMEVTFDDQRCIECLACIKNCPFGACTALF